MCEQLLVRFAVKARCWKTYKHCYNIKINKAGIMVRLNYSIYGIVIIALSILILLSIKFFYFWFRWTHQRNPDWKTIFICYFPILWIIWKRSLHHSLRGTIYILYGLECSGVSLSTITMSKIALVQGFFRQLSKAIFFFSL